jgi:hypothetical protein
MGVGAVGLLLGCSQRYDIVGGPSVSALTAAPSETLPPDSHQDQFKLFDSIQVSQSVSPKARILMVIDNSSSTLEYQSRFATGFQNFARHYFNKTNTLDLTVATITTDTYLADLSIPTRLMDMPRDACLSRLVPGIHDGSIPFIADGISAPWVSGTCNLTAAARQQIQNTGMRSLRPILSTMPPDGSEPDDAYFAQLISDFRKNAMPGAQGYWQERGFQSVWQFLKDNEKRPSCSQTPPDPSCLFRHYTLGGNAMPAPVQAVVFISDEHDHSVSDFGTGTWIDHGEDTIPSFSDFQMYSSSLRLVNTFKTALDRFFVDLHEASNPDPNYTVFAITNVDCYPAADHTCGVQYDGARDWNEEWGVEYAELVDAFAGNPGTGNARPIQAPDTVNSAAKYSRTYSIQDTQYDALFDYIAQQIDTQTRWVEVRNFTLSHAVTDVSSIVAKLILPTGIRIPIESDWLSVSGTTLSVSSQVTNLIQGSGQGVQIEVTYR